MTGWHGNRTIGLMSSLRAKTEEVSSEHSSSSVFPTNQTYRQQHKSVGSCHPAANSPLDFLYCCTPRSIPLIHLHTTTTALLFTTTSTNSLTFLSIPLSRYHPSLLFLKMEKVKEVKIFPPPAYFSRFFLKYFSSVTPKMIKYLYFYSSCRKVRTNTSMIRK